MKHIYQVEGDSWRTDSAEAIEVQSSKPGIYSEKGEKYNKLVMFDVQEFP